MAIIDILNDPNCNSDAKRYAAEALGEVAKGGKELPKEALEVLIKILNDPKSSSDSLLPKDVCRYSLRRSGKRRKRTS